jgi:ABC-type phosphate transport system permease subunit
MNGAFTPIAIAQAVARNIVPLVGILVFHWSAGNVLLLYLLDTVLSMAVIFAGLMSTFSPPPDDEGVGGWINSEAGYVLMGLFVAAFIAVPLGMPVAIMLAASGFSFREAFNDSSLRGGALLQTLAALWSYIELYRALRT